MVSAQDALKHVLKTMDIEDDTVTFLISKRISTVRKLAHGSEGAYKALVSEPDSKLFPPDVDQIIMFRHWFNDYVTNDGQVTNEDIVKAFTEEAWLEYSVAYTSGKISGLQVSGGGNAPKTSSKSTGVLKVSLKDYPTTSGKSSDWNRYRRKLIATATANGHEQVYKSDYRIPDPNTNPSGYQKYLELNAMAFSAIDYGTTDSTLRSKVEKYRDLKDGRAAFLELDSFQRGQGSDETCANNAWNKLQCLKLTNTFPGGVEAFLGKWDDIIEELKDVKQTPNEFLERTLLKQAILDDAYSSVITNLSMAKPPPTVDECKAEIRRAGTEIESKRKTTAIRKARFTQMDLYDPYEEFDAMDFDDEHWYPDDENHRLVAATQQAFRRGRGSSSSPQYSHNPWNLPSEVYRSLTPEQRKLWNDLREAARIRKTPSGTPRFDAKSSKDQYGGFSKASSASQSSEGGTAHRHAKATSTEVNDGTSEDSEETAQKTDKDQDNARTKQETFERDNLSEDQQRWLSHIRQANHTRTIDLSASAINGTLRFVHSTATTGKGKLMIDGCADTGVAAIGNGMVEVYTTDRQVSLIGFQDDLAKHNIPIGGAAAAIDLPQGTIIVQLNEVPLLKGGSNSLLSTNQAREFGVIVDDVARRYGGKQQLQANDTVIPLQYQRALMSTPIREPTKWELDNLPRVMLTSDEPWDPKELSEDDGQFLIELVDGGKELMNYADLINIFNKAYEDNDNDQLWTYEKILDHHKVSGNKWEVNVLWDTGEATWEPMDIIKADDKMTLIDTPGWKWARRLTNNPKKFIRMAKIFMTVAAGVIVLGHIPSKDNIADMLTKALGPIAHFPHMKAYLH